MNYLYKLFALLVCISLLLMMPFGDDYANADAILYHPSAVDGGALQQPTTSAPPSEQLWTRWHPNQYALADDGQSLWIGAAGGVVRWDKNSKTHQRYTAVDGLPHQNVYAVAVDTAGNRWFGGDGGLSRLDANNVWTHFTTANSGLHSNLVDGIAIGADNTLWVSHGLPAGSVSRFDPDGTWRWYPSRAVAVVTDYVRIKQTQNVNQLWSVAGNEIWVGYAVYNGSQWIDRTPANATAAPKIIAIDSKGVVWVLSADQRVYTWKAGLWESLLVAEPITSLAVGMDDTVWVGLIYSYGYGNGAGVGRLPDQTTFRPLNRLTLLTALLPAGGGVWAVGPGWLLQPDGTIYDFPDLPALPDVADVLAASDGKLWMRAQQSTSAYSILQTINDNGTAVLNDDVWQREPPTNDPFLTFERAPGGDLWIASVTVIRVPGPSYLLHQYQGQWLKHPLPRQGIFIRDLFAQDDNHIWLVYATMPAYSGSQQGVLVLDVKGTPTDFSDDQWTDYPINTDEPGNAVAVDARGRLWYGNNSKLYRHDGKQWQLIGEGGICDLVPANNGALFAQTSPCDQHHTVVFMIGADGAIGGATDVDSLVKANLTLVRSATRRNRLWTVAPDGAVWYVTYDYSDSAGAIEKLYRRSTTDLTTYALPFKLAVICSLEVAANNRVWMAADAALWRMTLRPDFSLAAQPNVWLLAPGDSRQGRVVVAHQEGFNATVALQISDLPSNITAKLEPNAVKPGERVTVTLTVNASAALGTHQATLIGVSNNITHTTSLTIAVVAKVFEQHLPLVLRH